MDARKMHESLSVYSRANTVPTLHPPPQLYHKETNEQMFCHTLAFFCLDWAQRMELYIAS